MAALLFSPLVLCAPSRTVSHYSDLGGKPYRVSWDSRSLRLDDAPVLLLSGSIHYVRSTPLQWPVLFAEARANGLNAIESYVFWSWHARGGPPGQEGSYYDYSGSGNVTRFLELAARYDLWVIWRFGPYVCAEWPGGGLPSWIRSVPGLKTRRYNQPWIDAVERWGRDHKQVIEPFLAENGGPIIMSQIENEYGGNDMQYFAWMANFTQRLLPNTAWVMCGHVAHVANGTIHTANGCANPETQGIGPHTTPGLPGMPRMYTEDEQWFDYWGQPNIARAPTEVAYGVAGFMATGGSMHNYYMWHGGNHYGNWSRSAPPWDANEPDEPNAPISNTNTVRYANAAAMHADGARNEPLWGHLGTLHLALSRAAPVLLTSPGVKQPLRCADSSPTKCTAAAHFRVTYGQPGWQQTNYSFLLNTLKANGTIVAHACKGTSARLATLPALTVVIFLEAATGCEVLFNSSALPPTQSTPISPAVDVEGWRTWPSGNDLWLSATFQPLPSVGNRSVLLDLNGLGAGRVWVNGWLVASYNLAIANCSVPRMPRCGATPVSASSPDGACGQPSQRYYSVPPEALLAGSQGPGAKSTLLLRETRTPLCCANHKGCHPCDESGPVVIHYGSVRIAQRRLGGNPPPLPPTPPAPVPTPSLRAPSLIRLPAAAIVSSGWLRVELTLQAKGLSGELPKFWHYINNSRWVGGTDGGQSGGHQYIPYYLNGIVPLSTQIGDGDAARWLRAVRDRYVDFILSHAEREPSGWLGPPVLSGHPSQPNAEGYWGKYLAVEALAALAEAEPKLAPRAIRALLRHHRTFHHQLASSDPPLDEGKWAFSRSSDALHGVQWLLDRPRDVVGESDRAMLFDLLWLLKNRTDGVANFTDWEAWFAHGDPFAPWHDDLHGDAAEHLQHHGVDIGEGMKQGALWWRVSGQKADLGSARVALDWVGRYAQMSDGMFFADEIMHGTNTPSRGTETCSVVETMFSMAVAYEASADVRLMDRLEELAFNSLPAALYPDATANVYHHASNQIAAANGQYAYSLFFCCSANVHQGWPKFTRALVHAQPGTIVISSYVPSRATMPTQHATNPGGTAAEPTVVEVSGSYPFADDASILIQRGALDSVAATHEYTRVRLRVPCYSDGLRVNVSGHVSASSGVCGFHDVALPTGQPEVMLRVHLLFPLRTRVWAQNSSAPGAVEVHRGPLTFALRPTEDVISEPINGSQLCATHKVTAVSPWNYALQVDPAAPEQSISVVRNGPVPSPLPFSSTAAPAITLRAKARRVPQWKGQGRAPHPPPPSPVTSSEPLEEVELVPFGATNVRISVFPVVL